MSERPNLRFLVGSTDSGDAVYGDFRRTGGFISTGHVGSRHASYDEAAFVTDLLQRYSPDELQFVTYDKNFWPEGRENTNIWRKRVRIHRQPQGYFARQRFPGARKPHLQYKGA